MPSLIEGRRLLRGLRPTAKEAQLKSFFESDDPDSGALPPRLKFLAFVGLVALGTTKTSLTEAGLVGGKGGGTESYVYNTTALIMLSEILKLAFSLLMCVYLFFQGRFDLERDGPTWRSAAVYVVPSVLYTVVNHIDFAVLQYIELPVIQAIASIKIAFSGILSHFVLGRRLSAVQWFAVVMLVSGSTIAGSPARHHALHNSHRSRQPQHPAQQLQLQLQQQVSFLASHPGGSALAPLLSLAEHGVVSSVPDGSTATASQSAGPALRELSAAAAAAASSSAASGVAASTSASPEPSEGEDGEENAIEKRKVHKTFVGIVMLVFNCLVSATAGLACAMLLSNDPTRPIHGKNALMYLGGVIVNFLVLVAERTEDPWFKNFTWSVWQIGFMQAAVGISVSIVFKHLGLVPEVLATVVTTIAITVVSVIFFDYTVTVQFVVGATIISFGFYFYYLQPRLPFLSNGTTGYEELPTDVDEGDDGLHEFSRVEQFRDDGASDDDIDFF